MGCCGEDREKAHVKEVHKWHYIVRLFRLRFMLSLRSLILLLESIRLQEFVMHRILLVPVGVGIGYNRCCRLPVGYIYCRQTAWIQSMVQ